jgi:hypothetical protein
MWRNLIYQVVMQIFVYPLVQDVVEHPFYFTFVSVPFSQILYSKSLEMFDYEYRLNQLAELKFGLF